MSFIFVVFKSTNKLAVSLLLTVAAASKDKKMAFCCLDCAAEFDASKNCRKRIVAGQHCSDAWDWIGEKLTRQVSGLKEQANREQLPVIWACILNHYLAKEPNSGYTELGVLSKLLAHHHHSIHVCAAQTHATSLHQRRIIQHILTLILHQHKTKFQQKEAWHAAAADIEVRSWVSLQGLRSAAIDWWQSMVSSVYALTPASHCDAALFAACSLLHNCCTELQMLATDLT